MALYICDQCKQRFHSVGAVESHILGRPDCFSYYRETGKKKHHA